ncbi:DNA-formamidopyrimidine glycosylase family protein [Pyxidicoccus sp. 3LFB2]
MAEVPEVEIIVRDLRQAVVGRRFTDAEVLSPVAVRFPSTPEFIEELRGRRVTAAYRRAKFILLPLDDGKTLAIHFMLWGDLKLRPQGSERLPRRSSSSRWRAARSCSSPTRWATRAPRWAAPPSWPRA